MDYTDPSQHDHVVGDGIDMDMVHDFGEGVGLDMRDFQSHDVDDRFQPESDNDPSKHLGEWTFRPPRLPLRSPLSTSFLDPAFSVSSASSPPPPGLLSSTPSPSTFFLLRPSIIFFLCSSWRLTKHSVLDPSLTGTPMNQSLKPEALTPHPPSSMNNGSHEPPSVNMDDMFHTETGLDDDDDDDDGDGQSSFIHRAPVTTVS